MSNHLLNGTKYVHHYKKFHWTVLPLSITFAMHLYFYALLFHAILLHSKQTQKVLVMTYYIDFMTYSMKTVGKMISKGLL